MVYRTIVVDALEDDERRQDRREKDRENRIGRREKNREKERGQGKQRRETIGGEKGKERKKQEEERRDLLLGSGHGGRERGTTMYTGTRGKRGECRAVLIEV